MNHIDRQKKKKSTNSQHGLWPKRSCETQLHVTMHNILQSLNDPKIRQVEAIILDFAFDKVPHQRLLAKLE